MTGNTLADDKYVSFLDFSQDWSSTWYERSTPYRKAKRR